MQIVEPQKCTGCTACMAICPNRAIQMKEAKDGFIYPVINNNCIECYKCKEVCPALNHNQIKYKNIYAVKGPIEKRKTSTSGAAFQLIAEEIFKQGGIVYGAAFDKNFELMQTKAANSEELKPILQTKYLQSNPKNTVKILEDNVPVLYVGPACLTQGIKNLNKENCILVDFICSGVISPKLWRKYKNSLGDIKSFVFRDKSNPNNGHTVKIEYENKTVEEEYLENKYCRIFAKSLGLRPACYSCNWAHPNRESDITLGDFWGPQNSMDDGYGVSIVITHTQKGEELLKNIEKTPIAEYTQPRLETPPPNSMLNKFFYKDLINDTDIDTILKKYGS